jgi:hypothetical protein
MKVTFVVGALTGLLVSAAILAMLWFGVSGVLIVGQMDLMYVFWPSSIMLVGGWRTTPAGIMTTISSVTINCLLYGVAAVTVYFLVRALGRLFART